MKLNLHDIKGTYCVSKLVKIQLFQLFFKYYCRSIRPMVVDLKALV